jgi:hypothetical protein
MFAHSLALIFNWALYPRLIHPSKEQDLRHGRLRFLDSSTPDRKGVLEVTVLRNGGDVVHTT